MKSKILKLSTVFLLLLLLGASCQKEEWETIALNDSFSFCGEVIGVLGTFTDYTGTIGLHPEDSGNKYYIFINKPEDLAGTAFFPCNLPEEYWQNELKIIFDGEVLNVTDWVDGIHPDFLGTPIKITTAKIQIK